MPRDANGNYTLPAGNPVISGTAITTVWANPTMQDLAIAITDSLSRTGEGGMLVPFLFPDGAVATPGMSWTNETKTGFYRAGTNDQRVSVNGVDSFRWTATGVQVWNSVDLIWEDVAIGANYLPLTGGTLTNEGEILTLKDSVNIGINTYAYASFRSADNTEMGTVGISNLGAEALRVIATVSSLELTSTTSGVNLNGTTSINLTAPSTNINSYANFTDLVDFSGVLADDVIIRFLKDGAIKGTVGCSAGSNELTIFGDTAINLSGGAVVSTAPVSIQNSLNTNTPLASKSGIDIFKDSGFSAFIGVVAGEQTTLRLNADLGDINLTTPTSIELNAPVVNVNGVPIGGQPKAGQKVGDGGTLHLVTFATPYPDTNYSAVATQYNSIGSVVSTNGKTTTGFYIITSVATNTLLDWIATPYS